MNRQTMPAVLFMLSGGVFLLLGITNRQQGAVWVGLGVVFLGIGAVHLRRARKKER